MNEQEANVINREFWRDRRVLVTGHTGFKGGWLVLWLKNLGAEVTGIALAPADEVSLFGLANIKSGINSNLFDIVETQKLNALFDDSRPEIVFHLAAQPLVRPSYDDPVETFSTNALGTATLLDAVRLTREVKACVMITSDKCYENQEWIWGYRETDAMGGHDPYSASKGVSELIISSMRRSFFAPYVANGHEAKIASVRAGNVIGGGDFSKDRLVPDIVKGCLANEQSITLRNPDALRPWQHVLEPLRGYLMLAERLAAGDDGMAEGWNFGPTDEDTRTVERVADALVATFGKGQVIKAPDANAPHEAKLLRLDCSKANRSLGWIPVLGFDDTIKMTADWYNDWARGADMRALTLAQITQYQSRAEQA